MKLKDWFAFLGLVIIWGSSFFWIRIALDEIGPVMLVAFRLLFGMLGLVAAIAILRPDLPRQRSVWVMLLILAVTNTAFPFILISWGEQFIESGVTSLINGSVPILTLIIAHFFLADERITLQRAFGIITGFGGLVLLVSRGFGEADFQAHLFGQLAVLLASLSYAGSAVFVRRSMRSISPIIQAFVTVSAADLIVWVLVPITESPVTFPVLPITWIGLVWLGLFGACIAYMLYFYLIQSIGATKTSLVTYGTPVVAVFLGVTFLDERLDWQLIAGAALIFAGIYIVNAARRRKKAALPQTRQEASRT